MPTYEYECDACGHEFERLQRMTEPAVRKCPKCTKLKVRRLISGGAGVIFKGSGFYETDYKRARSGSSNGAAADAKGESKSETKTESSSESKPAGGDAKKPSEKSSDKPAAKSDAPKKKDA